MFVFQQSVSSNSLSHYAKLTRKCQSIQVLLKQQSKASGLKAVSFFQIARGGRETIDTSGSLVESSIVP